MEKNVRPDPARLTVSRLSHPVVELETGPSSGPALFRKRVAEHWPAAFGLLLSCLVLDDVPVFDKDTILDSENVRRDPVHGCPEPRKPPMNDDEVAISHEHPGLVFQC